LIDKHLDVGHGIHLRNAVTLLVDNVCPSHEVVAIEKPFVMSLGKNLPPLVGVIDLILRKGDTFMVIDHKTGKEFYGQDDLQLILYREHVLRTYRPKVCRAYFDQYRWVNNLQRIRYPAFQRSPATLGRWAWKHAVERIQEAYRDIRRIEKEGTTHRSELCYMCPMSDVCPKARVRWESWW